MARQKFLVRSIDSTQQETKAIISRIILGVDIPWASVINLISVVSDQSRPWERRPSSSIDGERLSDQHAPNSIDLSQDAILHR